MFFRYTFHEDLYLENTSNNLLTFFKKNNNLKSKYKTRKYKIFKQLSYMYPFKIFDFYLGLKNRDAYNRLKRINNRYLKKIKYRDERLYIN